jgi:predicted nucleotidyltransferase
MSVLEELRAEALQKLNRNGIYLDCNVLAKLCKKYSIIDLSVFGSAIREDFSPESDVDFLVSFDISVSDESRASFKEGLKAELAGLVSRDVDVVETGHLGYDAGRKEILSTREVLYIDGV